ncbi:MAG: hypothetical protein J6A50_06395 [Clostridia bacterium]|nr:hypothetical protein [Clostridia bacterium]
MNFLEKARQLFEKSVNYVKSHSPKNNPEALIAEAEGHIEKSKKAAGKQLMAIQELTGTIKKELKAKEAELIDIQECVQLAVNENDKELLVSLLLQQEKTENDYLAQKNLYDNAVSDAVKISDSYRRFEKDVNELLKDLATLKTRAQFLKMREQIILLENRFEQQTLSGQSDLRSNGYRQLPPKNDIINKNNSRKKALEQAEALLQIKND